MSFAVIARYVCAEPDVEEVRAALLDAREGTLQEPANQAYIVHQDADDPRVFHLYEQYTDRSGFDAHTNSPHFAEHILGRVRPKLLDRTVTFANVL
ncbi:putative quinol monooxygenase [Saccharopolyspora mangrovi]|uniref:Quinol monooxygenase n=1 Tax=Saccharopolyspora mangrovi TaxID=3082379 RepID=A0ABU6ABI2_9PSEU|nr:putative quinol monooxygenase [Saccharopolyspora sp. S2-29]MEB3368905.1 putative quinol monooxygenase [Saccharopolyspora sp. S2-29]